MARFEGSFAVVQRIRAQALAIVPPVALSLAACSPALNWRDVQESGSGARLLFPCKPDSELREGGAAQAISTTMQACDAAGMSFAWSRTRLPFEARQAGSGTQLVEGLAQRLSATIEERPVGIALRAAEPWPDIPRRYRLQGRRGETTVEVQTLVFWHQQDLVQATVFGRALTETDVQEFFEGWRPPTP